MIDFDSAPFAYCFYRTLPNTRRAGRNKFRRFTERKAFRGVLRFAVMRISARIRLARGLDTENGSEPIPIL